MAGFGQDISFSFERRGTQHGRSGTIRGLPEAMREAFRAGYVSVIMPGGRRLRLQVVAHSEGSDTAYVQFTDPLADQLLAGA